MREQTLKLAIVLEKPPPGVNVGIQHGKGKAYQTLQVQHSTGADLKFEFEVMVKENKDGQPNFLGPFAQGPANARFVYLDIGQYAGETNSCWGRRLKVSLGSISWAMIEKQPLETRLLGTGRDGGPSCGSAKNVQWVSRL